MLAGLALLLGLGPVVYPPLAMASGSSIVPGLSALAFSGVFLFAGWQERDSNWRFGITDRRLLLVGGNKLFRNALPGELRRVRIKGNLVYWHQEVTAGSGSAARNRRDIGFRGMRDPEAVKAGIEEAMGAGTLGGYPAVGVRCTITGGSFHDVDSSDVAFKIAAGMAFQDAFAYGNPALLEPVMLAEVVTPEQYFGDVVNDLTTRRAQIVEVTSAAGDSKTIQLRVPLANMFGYATALRSVTQGRATYSMEPHSYEPVPAEQQRELLS